MRNTLNSLTSILGLSLALSATSALANPNGGGAPATDDPPIAVGAGWSETPTAPPAFYWGGGAGAFNTDGPFTFTAGGPVVLSVTDAFNPGDQFRIYDFGSVIGVTSVPGVTGAFISGDPNVTFGDSRFSFGTFALGAGSHSITIETIVNPFGGGRGYLRVDPSRGVPDAGSMLAALGLGLLGVYASKKRSA